MLNLAICRRYVAVKVTKLLAEASVRLTDLVNRVGGEMKKPVKEDCYCTEHDYLTHGCQCEFKEWNDAIDEYDAWLKEKIDNLLPFIDNYPFTDSLFPSQIVEITNAITKHLLEE